MALLGLSLRRAAIRLPAPSFVCRQCLRQQRRPAPASRLLDIVRSRSYASFKPPLASASTATVAQAAVAQAASGGSTKGAFPETSSRAVAYWLLGSAASVFGIVVFGGLTRLTESGLVLCQSQGWEYKLTRL